MSEIQDSNQGQQETTEQKIERLENAEHLTPEEVDFILNAEVADEDNSTIIEKSEDRAVIEPEVKVVETQPKEESEFKSLKEKYWEKSQELNTIKQKYQNLENSEEKLKKRLKEDPIYREAYLKELGIVQENKTTQTDEEDYLDESYIRGLKEEIAGLKQKFGDIQQQSEEQRRIAEQEEKVNREFREIEEVQSMYPNLKTSKPFKELNNDYLKWYNAFGKENADRYYSDKEFRQKMDNEGLGFGEDFDTLQDIFQIYNDKKEKGYPTFKSAYRDSDIFDNHQSQKSNTNYQDSTGLVVEKMQQLQSDATVMNKTGAIGDTASTEMSEEAMMKWLNDHPDSSVLTPDELAIRERILKIAGVL